MCVSVQLNDIKESQKRTAAVEESNGKLQTQRLKELQEFEKREEERFKYIGLIQKAVNIMCQHADYKDTT